MPHRRLGRGTTGGAGFDPMKIVINNWMHVLFSSSLEVFLPQRKRGNQVFFWRKDTKYKKGGM
jgi:hypothetical protein